MAARCRGRAPPPPPPGRRRHPTTTQPPPPHPQELEPPALSTLLHAAGTRTEASTSFSRAACLRLTAAAADPATCVHAPAMLAPPLLPKLLGLLARSLRDSDAAVRAAAAEGFGTLAAQMSAAQPEHGGGAVLAAILEALADPAAPAQAAAGAALAAAAHYICADGAVLRQVLRAAAAPLFAGRAELWPAVARLEGGHVRGLVASSFNTLLAAWPEVLGSGGGEGRAGAWLGAGRRRRWRAGPPSADPCRLPSTPAAEGTGLLGTLTGRGKDFQARAAAANTLKVRVVGV